MGCNNSKTNDPFLWLEDIEGERALSWVKNQNSTSKTFMESDPNYPELRKSAEIILHDKKRIPYGSIRGDYIYNFWRDEKHVRGILRRTKIENYLNKQIRWELVLDVDTLAKKEKGNWVYHGSTSLEPDHNRCLVHLSRGGKDAEVIREFDLQTKTFIKNGFFLKEAKTSIDWFDKNTLIVGTDFGADSLTKSGYPRILKKWHRGDPFTKAKTIFEATSDDMSVGFMQSQRIEETINLIIKRISFYESEYWQLGRDDKLIKIPVPSSAEMENVFHGRLLFKLREPWKTNNKIVPEGSLVAVDTKKLSSVDVIFSPGKRESLLQVATTNNYIYLSILSNVAGKIQKYKISNSKAKFLVAAKIVKTEKNGTIYFTTADKLSDKTFFVYENFLTPSRLYYLDEKNENPKQVKTLDVKFDSNKFTVNQHESVSKDGTRIPYFIIHKKGMKLNGQNPTLLYGYGGFEVPELPQYLGLQGKLWLEKGGVYVLSNIRGGGEFGPNWHRAGLKENRQKVFDDFISVAEDLINRKITQPSHLGIMGGSNGGLLVGAVFTQRPELFNAVVCLVPLLDMLKFSKLLAGHSWIAEYGDPDNKEMRSIIKKYSPYHNLKRNIKYPEVFFTTSTKDDRVHPGHARKMVAKMLNYNHKVYYFENTEGGHGAAANLLQSARLYALIYTYLHKKLSKQE